MADEIEASELPTDPQALSKVAASFKEIQLVGVSSAKNVADVFTKSGIPGDSFKMH